MAGIPDQLLVGIPLGPLQLMCRDTGGFPKRIAGMTSLKRGQCPQITPCEVFGGEVPRVTEGVPSTAEGVPRAAEGAHPRQG